MVCHVLRVPGGTKTKEHCVSLFVQPLSAYTLSDEGRRLRRAEGTLQGRSQGC